MDARLAGGRDRARTCDIVVVDEVQAVTLPGGRPVDLPSCCPWSSAADPLILNGPQPRRGPGWDSDWPDAARPMQASTTRPHDPLLAKPDWARSLAADVVIAAGRGRHSLVRECPLGTGQDRCEWHGSGTAGEDNVRTAWQPRHRLDRRVRPVQVDQLPRWQAPALGAQALSSIRVGVGRLTTIQCLQILLRLVQKSCNGPIAFTIDHIPHELFHCRTE
jgi:hypothetical protein